MRLLPLLLLPVLACGPSHHPDALLCQGSACNPPAQQPAPLACEPLNAGANCGSCAAPCEAGWMCLGASCAQVLASGLDRPMSLIVDDGLLYWTSWGTSDALGNPNHDGAVERMSLDGSGRTLLAGALDEPAKLAADSSALYWVSKEGPASAVQSVAKSGGAVATLVHAAQVIGGFGVDDSSLYWAHPDTESTLLQAPKTGGSGTPLMTTPGELVQILVAADALYWNSGGNVWRKAPDEPSARSLASGVNAGSLGLGIHGLYWLEYTGGDFELRQMDLAGAAVVTLARLGDPVYPAGDAFGFSFDGAVGTADHAYFPFQVQLQQPVRNHLIVQRAPAVAPVTSATSPPIADFQVGATNGVGPIAEHGGELYLMVSGPAGAILRIRD